MSLFSEYLSEIGGRKIVEKEHGFATYRLIGKECYIVDMYIQKAYRKTYLASEMAREIEKDAKANGCIALSCTVELTPGWETRKEVMERYGFKVFKEEPDYLVFCKELV